MFIGVAFIKLHVLYYTVEDDQCISFHSLRSRYTQKEPIEPSIEPSIEQNNNRRPSESILITDLNITVSQ